MGFWDTVGAIGKAVMNYVKEKGEKRQTLKNKFEYESNAFLAKKFWNGYQDEKRVAFFIMKERYGKELAKSILQFYR